MSCRASCAGSLNIAKYFIMNDISSIFFERLRDKMVPIIIEKRRAMGDSEKEIENFIDLYSWVGPSEAMARINVQKP